MDAPLAVAPGTKVAAFIGNAAGGSLRMQISETINRLIFVKIPTTKQCSAICPANLNKLQFSLSGSVFATHEGQEVKFEGLSIPYDVPFGSPA